MTTNNKPASRDDVLFAFHQAYAKPTAAQIEEWTGRYPEFADDIIAHAAISYDWAANEDAPTDDISPSEYANAFSCALSAVYEAEREAADASEIVVGQTLRDLMKLCGKDVRGIQREIAGPFEIQRSIVADFFNGEMLPPLSNRFAVPMRRSLGVSASRFDAAHRATLNDVRVGHANAQSAPTVRQRTYTEIVQGSDMTEEQIRYWLADDI